MRFLLCMFMAGIVPAMAVERSAPLSIESARALVAGAGINRGKVFAVGDDRYALGVVTVERHGTTEFIIRVLVLPQERQR
jgi:hypothetical protein